MRETYPVNREASTVGARYARLADSTKRASRTTRYEEGFR
jgi:hypothetical protein